MLFSLIVSPAQSAITDGLVAYWPFDEESGGVTLDETGHGFDGNLVDGAYIKTTEAKVYPGCLEVDGDYDQVYVYQDPGLRQSTDLSVSAWMKADSGGDFCGIIENSHDTGTTESGWGIAYDTTWRFYDSSNFFFYLKTTGNSGFVGIGEDVGTGSWHHIVATWDNSSNELRVYIDGLPDSANPISTLGTIDWDPVPDELSIGLYHDDDEDFYFDGLIDEVAIWDRGLDASEVEYLYNSGHGNPLMTNIIYVDTFAGGSDDGSTWTNAYNDMQDALTAAGPGDQIWVAQGTYYPSELTDPCDSRSATFQLENEVEMYGGFPSSGGNWADRDPDTYITILSGDLLHDDGPGQWEDYDENSYHVVVALPPGPNTRMDDSTVFDGFTVTAGYADSSYPDNSGAGMYNNFASPIIANCKFSDNYAANLGYGGGMYNVSGSDPNIVNCIFSGNYASTSGGGLANDTSNPKVINCTFEQNSAVNFDGGGMFNNADPLIVGCVFLDNEANRWGGGFANIGASANPKLINCKFIGNLGDYGGGMTNTPSNGATLVNCMFIVNIGTTQGGGIYNNGAGLTMKNCSLYQNQATNSFGGGLYMSASSSVMVDNSIFWGNTDSRGNVEAAQIHNSLSSLWISYSCVQYWSGGMGGTGNIGGNPQFEDPDGSDNVLGTNDDHLRLGSGSACVDAASNSAVPADTADLDNDENTTEPTPVDIDMALRFIDDPYTSDTGAGTPPIVDMGAYEHKTVCFVDSTASGLNDGSSWSNAFNYLMDALALAASGTEIWVAEGTYKPDEFGTDRTASFFLWPGRELYGGFPPGGGSWASRHPVNNVTILSGDLNDDDGPGPWEDYGENSYHVLDGTDADATAIIDGFTISGGYADGAGLDNLGAGLLCVEGFGPTVNNCFFTLNYADHDGGAIANSPGEITNCTITNNAAGLDGGGLKHCSGTVTSCIISGNTAGDNGGGLYKCSAAFTGCTISNNSSGESGGGMYNSEVSPPTVTNCTFYGNSATVTGGGMHNEGSSLTITDCSFEYNDAEDGGGMFNIDSSPDMTGCEFIANYNSGPGGGGGMCTWDNSNPIVTNCTFKNNSGYADGGAIHNGNSSPTFTNCTFIANSVDADFVYGGGAIFNGFGGTPTLNSCQFVANTSAGYGGAVCNAAGSTATITGCTFMLNTADEAGGAIYGHYSKYLIANSEDEFSDTQGQDNWYYGYYVWPFTSATFQQLDTFEDPFWKDLDLDPDYPLKWDTGGIPGFDEWVVGRWVSEVAGTVSIYGNIAISNDPCGMCGDGTTGRIIVDGVEKWNQYVPFNHAEWIPYSINVNVGIGSTVDFAIDPYGSTNWCDQTMFVAEIEEVPPSEYPTVSHSILWDNMSMNGPQVALDNSVMRLTYCNVQGGESAIHNNDSVIDWETNNIDEDPNLTPNPHLKAGSPCIDAGDPAFVVDPCAPYDIDGENRIINGRVDIGADEFLDTDADGLPDFWESLHFESATGASASGDPDNDGLTNLEEYELFGSDPNADPIYVDVDNPGDPCEDGSSAHPFDTIQEGLDAADDGDTVLVADGTYTGAGNKELDFAGKSIVLRAISGAASTTIDCEDSGRAFDFDDGETSGAAVIGFTMTNGDTDYGGAIRCDHSHPQFRDCIITANTATVRGGGVYSTYSVPTFADCTIGSNEPNGVWAEYGGAKIFGDVKLDGNDWVGNNLMLTGDGTIKLYSGAKLDLADSEIRCNVAGMYDIIVDVGETLTVSGNATIDLATLNPTKSNPNYGTIDCKGKLKVKGKAKIIHANIFVTQASVEDEAELSSNFISVNSWAPYGQFFIDQTAKVYNNEIHTDGDRIMNLKPAGFAGLIANNELYITITEGAGDSRGGLLECRGADGWANSTCYDPNIFFCQVQPGGIPPFDPNTWTLEELVFIPDAKANLTNLSDFQKPYDSGGADEVLYVKHLVLGAGAVLNTAYNRIYYDTSSIAPTAVIVNEPLLGFSLINIAFDDEIEFLVRVAHNTYIHPTDPNLDLIYVERIEGLRPDPAGMMRMKNIGDADARAKGLFSKAEEDQVLIRFEYLFETTDPDVELVIYLSDEPELLSGNNPARASCYRQVDRLPVPLVGQPGSDGSDRFGVYQKYVSPGNLDFVRGTRIELELIGPDGASVLINNWDPQVHCSGIYCKDVTGDKGVTVVDFLTVIGEYGESAGLQPDGSSSVCLDGIFSNDGYVDADDISGWDWTLNSEDRKNLCNTHIPLTDDPPNKSACGSCPTAKSVARPPLPSTGPIDFEGFEGAFLVAGKMYEPSEGSSLLRYLSDKLYGFDENARFVDRFEPVYERTNGRLVQDHDGVLYQLNLEEGLVRLSDAQLIIPAGQDSIIEPRYDVMADVYVGLQGVPGNWSGRPIVDVAFDSDGFVYVVPVVVDIGTDPNLAYTAAAKLQLSGGIPPYDVVQLYDDPDADSENDNRELNWLREIEVDSDGHVYVANAHGINESDVLWVYDSDTGTMQTRVGLSDPNAAVYTPAPMGMHVSDTTGSLYLASSQTGPAAGSASLYIMSCDDVIQSAPDEISVQTVEINGMGHITGVTVDPATGTAWILGFKMEDIPYKPTATDEAFYKPYVTQLTYGSSTTPPAVCLYDPNSGPESNLALPSSIVWTGVIKCGGVDLDGSGIVNLADFAFFTTHWLETGCAFPVWCEGTDLDPVFTDRGQVNLNDIAIFARYWLEIDCN